MTMEKINAELPTISIVRRCIAVKQGNSVVYLTKNDVNVLRMLQEGKYDGCYVGDTIPHVKYQLLADNRSILATCKDDAHNDIVYLSPKAIKLITKFRDTNRPRLAFDRDFRGRY